MMEKRICAVRTVVMAMVILCLIGQVCGRKRHYFFYTTTTGEISMSRANHSRSVSSSQEITHYHVSSATHLRIVYSQSMTHHFYMCFEYLNSIVTKSKSSLRYSFYRYSHNTCYAIEKNNMSLHKQSMVIL